MLNVVYTMSQLNPYAVCHYAEWRGSHKFNHLY
jgi:hypothetical protein